jgi:hypothetical protein
MMALELDEKIDKALDLARFHTEEEIEERQEYLLELKSLAKQFQI